MVKHFLVHHDGIGFYAYDVYADSKKEAKAQIKERYNLKRLPNNFCIWEIV